MVVVLTSLDSLKAFRIRSKAAQRQSRTGSRLRVH
jgi:hypothetical protein